MPDQEPVPRAPSMLNSVVARLWALAPTGLIKFLGVGVVGLATNLGLLWVLERAGMALWAALAISLVSATFVTWVLNRIHTFGGSGRAMHHEALRYFAVAGLAQSIGYVATLGVADVLPHLPHVAAAFIGAVVATLFSYTGQRFFTFAPAGSEPVPAPLAAPAAAPGE